MSTTTPSIRTQVAATVKRCTVIVGVIVGFAIGCQVGSGTDPAEDSRPTAVPTVQTVEPREDDPAFDCRIHGNQVCGPTGEHEAGCYNAGTLVMPWSEELRALDASPCSDVLGTYEVPGGSLTVYEDTSARYTPEAGGAELGRPLVGCDRTAGPCTAGELTGVDRDGELMIARDLNGDGVIAGDVEYGS